jgi:hypothetical protein
MDPKGKAYTLISLGIILLLSGPPEAGENDLAWSTFLGGTNSEYAYGIALDGSGNAYLAGQTSSSDFPVTAGAFDDTLNGADAFVAKLNSTGNDLDYATYLGGSTNDEINNIAVDGTGNAYVIGVTWSVDFPTTGGAFDDSSNGLLDVFVAKLNSTGSDLDYATYLGGSSFDFGYGIAVDESSYCHVTGVTWSEDFPTTADAFDTTYNEYEAFIVKLNPAGSGVHYATFLGGGSEDYGYGLALDDSRSVYVTGYTNSTDFPTTAAAFDTSQNGGYDVFVVKLSPGGDTLYYGTFLGGGNADYGYSIVLDDSRYAYVTGETNSSDFPTTTTAFDTSYNANSDAFVSKLAPAGDAIDYASFLGGTDSDIGYDIALDEFHCAYVTGETYSTNFPTTSGTFDSTQNGDSDAFITKFNSTGSGLDYTTYLGGGSSDVGYSIAIQTADNIYLTGHTNSASFPKTAGALDTTFNGGDAFVTKFVINDTTMPEAIDDLDIALEGGPKSKGSDIRLRWSEPYDDGGVVRYVIYRSSAATSLGDSLAGTADTTYADVGAAGDVDTNYCYVVKAVDADDKKSGESNKVGEYDYDLRTTTGTDYTWIVLCLGNTSLDSASHLEAHIEANSSPATNCYTISEWNPTAQTYTNYATIPVPAGNFPLQPGNSYRVEMSTDAVWTLTGDVMPLDSVSFQLETTTGTDYTWISIPMRLASLDSASDLEAHIEANSSPATDCYTISKWNTTAQTYTNYTTIPVPAGNFPVEPGQAYRVEVSNEATWPYAGKGMREFQRALHIR